ncbi:histidine phosphatase family protein [Arcanobacterium hippocoleae]|uniref:Phosphoglycerate mutase n=1 Tax=Arcanobacterium hippocoleae TaxID=149017 RepID=A0ABU1T429_9ACTO|nr:histidine phosphatase family protein [Arcanobacterium hippocoleae]MDR6940146.1 putative phosphoglycerate mutase [Arcanobacterium hippocoleae]
MPAKQIVFWRHGQTAQNLAGRIQGSTDNPLNDTGLAQAQHVAPHLQNLGITKVYCSDLIRARQTAQAFLDLTQLQLQIDPRLRERSYGLWEGLTAAEISASWPSEYQYWRNGNTPVSVGVEERLTVARRVTKCVEDALAASSDDDVILFVAHGGSIVNGIMGLLGMNPDQWTGLHGLDNCHWALLEARPLQNPRWRLCSYNRTVSDTDSLSHFWR